MDERIEGILEHPGLKAGHCVLYVQASERVKEEESTLWISHILKADHCAYIFFELKNKKECHKIPWDLKQATVQNVWKLIKSFVHKMTNLIWIKTQALCLKFLIYKQEEFKYSDRCVQS